MSVMEPLKGRWWLLVLCVDRAGTSLLEREARCRPSVEVATFQGEDANMSMTMVLLSRPPKTWQCLPSGREASPGHPYVIHILWE